MGLAIPRPAIRAKEDRVIRARLRWFDERLANLRASDPSTPDDLRRSSALREAQALRFTRDGKLKDGQLP